VIEQVAGICADASDALGFAPATRVSGPVRELPDDIAVNLLAVIREALTNVARHARARSAAVEVDVTNGTVTARVTDDGIGLAGAPRHVGLADLRRRAAWHGGTLSVGPGRSGGTQLLWTVPYRSASPQPR
jgi:two-component system sensor histidine kinase DevS